MHSCTKTHKLEHECTCAHSQIRENFEYQHSLVAHLRNIRKRIVSTRQRRITTATGQQRKAIKRPASDNNTQAPEQQTVKRPASDNNMQAH